MTGPEAREATACPKCASQPGEKCREGVGPWHYIDEVHPERVEMADCEAGGSRPENRGIEITTKAFDAAVAEVLF